MPKDNIHGYEVTKLESGEAFRAPRLVNEGFPFETVVLQSPPSTRGNSVSLLKLGSMADTNRRKIRIPPAFLHSDEASCLVTREQLVQIPLPSFSSPGPLGERRMGDPKAISRLKWMLDPPE